MNGPKLILSAHLPESFRDHRRQHDLAYSMLERELERDFPGEKALTGMRRTEKGKPYLPDHPSWHFNISHCRSCVALAIDRVPVGVDVEKRFGWKESLGKRISHPLEWDYLLGLPQNLREDALGRLWSRKESYLKCIGSGFSLDPQQVCLLDLNDKKPSSRLVTEEGIFWFLEWQNGEFTLCLCSRIPSGRS